MAACVEEDVPLSHHCSEAQTEACPDSMGLQVGEHMIGRWHFAK